MAVVNLTPDSFSGDGIYKRPDRAADLAERLVAAGADVLDLGGESTRPGYTPVPAEEELERVIPALTEIASRVQVPLSVDTSKAQVARLALTRGASIINDVSGLRDPDMASCVAEAGASLVLVHSREPEPGEDLMDAICRDLRRQIDVAEAAGVVPTRIVVDPGLGIGKGWRSPKDAPLVHRRNFEIIRRLRELSVLQKPVLVGPSRKGMIAGVLGPGADARLEGTIALVGVSVAHGADMVRVHDVREMAQVTRMMDALSRPPSAPPAYQVTEMV